MKQFRQICFPRDWKIAEREEWNGVADYCANDVIATEAAFDRLQQDQ